jgi:glutamate-ammonia-ligase adenylyltransferase
LRIVRGNARDLTLPPLESEEFAFLARRLGYEDQLARLRSDLDRHVADVLELSQRLLG